MEVPERYETACGRLISLAGPLLVCVSGTGKITKFLKQVAHVYPSKDVTGGGCPAIPVERALKLASFPKDPSRSCHRERVPTLRPIAIRRQSTIDVIVIFPQVSKMLHRSHIATLSRLM